MNLPHKTLHAFPAASLRQISSRRLGSLVGVRTFRTCSPTLQAVRPEKLNMSSHEEKTATTPPGSIWDFSVTSTEPWLNILNGANRDSNKEYVPRKVTMKKMEESVVEVLLPLKSNPELAEHYINTYGGVRIGKVLEDLDRLAASVAYKHNDDGSRGWQSLIIMTAAVDRIDILKPFDTRHDFKLSGKVIYVGYSSMEVLMKVETIPSTPNEASDTILIARFTMVARDKQSKKSAQVNPLTIQNDAEKKLFQAGEELKSRKRNSSAESLLKRPPNAQERLVIHDLHLEGLKYADQGIRPDNMVWMDETPLQSYVLCQPQDRNIQNSIFGGYLMRLAFELAYSNACLFIKGRPYFLALDDISFKSPVGVGSILSLNSKVVYSPGGKDKKFQISVVADVLDHEKSTKRTTNVFHFTFAGGKSAQVPRIMPKTYAEAMEYLEGRKLQEGKPTSRELV
ncbi:Thioesterase/thiol ester dehydrase-isomerase [Basidiobolus meristosporus CBS 931.73]|uniref:Thioesterase/thiol ester dehydrase-isomerase n=1 Tax=Basidiobolus meristosporus CBS 931.73 TaxID=1314790 RepID=A0A1Y1XP67_9FUNG|nr:Thioesterase/thiol ester dehydrase-isomerase [Basidiobolus meristosporus CBS 931.73]|eukprot:ORX87532.1 Thioesterase/thiol ester dehydrase-isomerase [Basidiobolus meristosporus CBS 931.73]